MVICRSQRWGGDNSGPFGKLNAIRRPFCGVSRTVALMHMHAYTIQVTPPLPTQREGTSSREGFPHIGRAGAYSPQVPGPLEYDPFPPSHLAPTPVPIPSIHLTLSMASLPPNENPTLTLGFCNSRFQCRTCTTTRQHQPGIPWKDKPPEGFSQQGQ